MQSFTFFFCRTEKDLSSDNVGEGARGAVFREKHGGRELVSKRKVGGGGYLPRRRVFLFLAPAPVQRGLPVSILRVMMQKEQGGCVTETQTTRLQASLLLGRFHVGHLTCTRI